MNPIVMVVEDDEALRESVCEALEDDGYRAVCMDGGASALERLRSDPEKPSLILLDLMMPGMTGWDFREEQLHDHALAPIPTVVMTASRELKGIDASEVVFKPLTREKLLAVVHRHTPHEQPPSPPSKPRVDLERLFGGAGEARALLRSKNWSQTPLGPLETWPRSLIAHASMVMELPSPAIIFWGPDQRQLYNEGYAEIMGPRHPQFFGEPYKDCWPDTYPVIYPWMQRVLEKGEVLRVEKEHITVTRYGFSEETYFTFTFSPLRDDGGAIAGIFQPVNEVTEVVLSDRRAETIRALAPRADSTNPTKDVVQALSANPRDLPFFLIYVWDEGRKQLEPTARSVNVEGSFAKVDELARKVFESNAALELDEVEASFGGAHLGPWPESARKALALPMVRSTADSPRGVVVFGLSPRLRFNEPYRRFLEIAAGQVTIAMATTHALHEAQRRAETLTELDRAKTVFFSNVSHEFRTPLTLMLGPVHDLLEGVHGQVAPEQRRQLELLHRNGLRLQKLVNSLLDFSRIEAGRVQASYAPVDLAALTRGLAAAFETATQRAGLRLVVDCPPLDERVYVDREMWEKIVLNLLSNALKFTHEGSIEVSLRSSDGNAVLRVTDTGIGIPPEEVPRLFERFHRVEGASARTHEGSGIGLALVNELVKLHAGSLGVESKPGSGTTFFVKVPKGTAHLPPERIGKADHEVLTSTEAEPFVEEALRWLPAEDERLPSVPPVNAPSTIAEPAPEARPPGTPRILLADDNKDMREYVRPQLERHWIVDTANDGARALEAVRATPPDLVLTDIMMPVMNGLELLHHLKSDERTSGIPVLMLSAQTTEEAKLEGLRAGAADYLTKPFSGRELVARVRTHLELARLRNEVRAQREHLFSMFMQAPVPICVFRGHDLVFELANPLYDQVTGVKNTVGKPLFEAIPETRGQGYEDLLRGVMATGKPFIGKEMLVFLDRNHDGVPEETFFNLTLSPIHNIEGVADRVMAIVYDVTDQVEARHRIEDSEKRFRELVEQVKDYAIFRMDERGFAVTWNEGVQRVLGFDESEFIGIDTRRIFPPEDVEAGVPERELATAAQEGSASNDRWMMKKSGERFAAAGVTSAVRGDHGELLGFSKVLRDQTAKVRAEEAAAHLAAIVTSSDDAIISTDLKGTITSWNKGAEQLYGYPPEEALGKPFSFLIPEDRQNEEPAILQRIQRGETVAHYETVRQRKDGRLLDVSLTASPVQDPAGRVIGSAKIARDITFRKRLDEAMRESEERFRSIFEFAEVSIWEQDFSEVKRFLQRLQREHGPSRLREHLQSHPDALGAALALIRIRDVNPATLRLFDAKSKEALVSSLGSIFRPETQAVWLDQLIAVSEGKRFFSAEVALQTMAGKRRDVLLTMHIPEDPQRVLATLTDISAQKLAETEREARVAEMERAVHFSEMFIGILGHDLRNPLSAITMAASLLGRNAESPKLAKPVNRIRSSAARMERMISQLLDFTRVRLGHGIPLEPGPVELAEVCRAVIGELETGTGCHMELEQHGDTHGQWDRDRLAQLVSNLAANACHHGAKGRPITLRLDGSAAERVKLEVINDGVIPPEMMPMLFEPLRYSEDLKRIRSQSSGLGLGLYITQQIVLAHGGTIQVESDEARGTRFLVELPRHAPAAAGQVFGPSSPR